MSDMPQSHEDEPREVDATPVRVIEPAKDVREPAQGLLIAGHRTEFLELAIVVVLAAISAALGSSS